MERQRVRDDRLKIEISDAPVPVGMSSTPWVWQ